MNSTLTKIILLFGLLLPFSMSAQDKDVKADVVISFQQDQEIWAGQQVTVNLDLKSTGFSFSDTHFNLPDVSGAFLMQTDTTTIKFSEKTEGENWSVIRYPLALYPQKSGQLEIPPITVRFNTSAGFGSPDKAFEFQTEPLQLTVKLPPGVKEGTLLVTTASFDLTHDWQPESGAAKTGDAFTLTVRRRADEISAMLLPPIPVFRTEGLATYPQAPEVNDKTNRGDLTGERIDSIIWVAEKPGNYDIPGIRFQWWDPDNHELKQQINPGLKLDVLASPADKTTTDTTNTSARADNNYLWLLLIVLTALAAVFLWLHFGRRAANPAVDSEKLSFASLQAACKNNSAGQSHSALHAWLAWSSPPNGSNARPATLDEFALAIGDTQLATELNQLQEAMVYPNPNWQGAELLSTLQRIRRMINKQKAVQLGSRLAPLNP